MLTAGVTELKGVGEKAREELALLNIYTIKDLLYYFPMRYDVYEKKPLGELIHDDQVTITGTVLYEPTVQYYGKRKSRLSFTLEIDGVAVKAVMFNRAFAKKHIQAQEPITLTGKWDAHRLQITVNTYKLGEPSENDTIQAFYPLKGKMTNNRLRKLIKQALNDYSRLLVEYIPDDYLHAYKIPTLKEAIKNLHLPENKNILKHARRRMIYEEFLLFQLKVQLVKREIRQKEGGFKQEIDESKLKAFISSFPFSLTDAQNRSLQEILFDMQSNLRMNRLLQGDVGSGKTAVAAICLYGTVTGKKQGALMVPTEILAEQHVESLQKLFKERARVALLTGSLKKSERDAILNDLKNGEIDIVVGTHALIQDDVFFKELGLVIVDEQHRFGVEQRRKLREKGLDPDVLFMTATPIPRTLAITAFGDMDVSIIDELPSGRKEIETYWVKENMFERTLSFIEKRVKAGEQAYVICPLIEESDKLDISNAVDIYHQLLDFFPKEVRVGLMHGRLTAEEKDEIMNDFSKNKVQVLVSTTVVEVGVNVPNASVMVIYDAQRFGLSQLHQLRGRVGRGDKQSYCILIADPKGEVGKERMKIMTETNDGFALAEQDLQLRGPGDFFGKKQSGLPEFKVADMVHDYRALETARQDAQTIILENRLETDPKYQLLHRKLERELQPEQLLD